MVNTRRLSNNTHLTIRMPIELKAKLYRLAKESKKTAGQVIRELIEDKLKKQNVVHEIK